MTVIPPQPRQGKLIVLFSKQYLPLARINLKRAATLLVTGRAEPLDFSVLSWQLRSPRMILTVPEHIRLTLDSADRIWKVPPVNRREVLRRDQNTCQYCGSKKNLTIDHVVPRSKGGLHTWDNVVIACAPCNGKKGDQLLSLTQMSLKRSPKAPLHPVVAFAENFWKTYPPSECLS